MGLMELGVGGNFVFVDDAPTAADGSALVVERQGIGYPAESQAPVILKRKSLYSP